MSELPWENKKIADIMSSVADELEMSPDISEKKKAQLRKFLIYWQVLLLIFQWKKQK